MYSTDKKIFPSKYSSSNIVSRGASAATLVSQSSGLDKLKKLADSLDPTEYDDKSKNSVEILRLKLKDFLHNNFFGGVYQMILLVLSVISVFQYIYGTYLDTYTSQRINEVQSIMQNIELVFAGIFGFDWCLNLFLADHRRSFLTRFVMIFSLICFY